MTLTTPQRSASNRIPDSPQSNRRRQLLRKIVPILTALIGIAILLYPVLATRHNDAEQQERANQYQVEIDNTGEARLQKELDDAETYNRELVEGMILDPFLEDIVPNTPSYQRYLKELDALSAMGQIKIPKIGVNLPIYHGTEEKTLKKGVGHRLPKNTKVGESKRHEKNK